ncbi:MAG: molybdopterin-binding protein [Hymenobacter sp.]
MDVEIMTIGDELLYGQVVDTNSAFMGQQLGRLGLRVRQITSVSDRADELVAALDQARQRASVILMTGGLGPTKDDLTKHVLARYLGRELVLERSHPTPRGGHFCALPAPHARREPPAGAGAGRLPGALQCRGHRARHVAGGPGHHFHQYARRALRDEKADDRPSAAPAPGAVPARAHRARGGDDGRAGRVVSGRENRGLGKCPTPTSS